MIEMCYFVHKSICKKKVIYKNESLLVSLLKFRIAIVIEFFYWIVTIFTIIKIQ